MPASDNQSAGTACLRISCYGFAERNAGSVASANYVVLEEFLRKGHLIDFFGKPSFAYPTGFEQYPNFRFINTEGRLERILSKAAATAPRRFRSIIGRFIHGQTCRNVPSAMCREHKSRHYHVCLYLGTWAFGRVPGLPMISWVQGPPGTDSRSIARQAKEIRRLEGNLRYIALRLYAAYRTRIGRPPFAHTDIAICGSQWAAEDLAKHVGPGVQIKTLPYPVDLNTFCPPAHAETQTEPVVLWAGRTVPRKRLDLFLDACDRLIANGSPIQVRVVGGFEFTPGYKKFLSDFRYRDRLHYDAAVPRSTMPDEYRRAAVLVQTSEDENFGSAVAEGLACSTPVVLGPTNGTGDYMEDGGIRFERYDSEAVAIAISKALYNNCTLANFARKAAEKNFHPTQIAGRLEEILFSAIGRTSDVDH